MEKQIYRLIIVRFYSLQKWLLIQFNRGHKKHTNTPLLKQLVFVMYKMNVKMKK